jgi:hypothetical protein
MKRAIARVTQVMEAAQALENCLTGVPFGVHVERSDCRDKALSLRVRP